MELVDKKKKKLRAKKDLSNTPFKAQAVVPTKSQRGFSTKRPRKATLSYPL